MDIILKSDREEKYFYIHWWFTDHCNYDCSYCHDVLKNGSTPFLMINTAKDFLDRCAAHCRKINKIPHLFLKGGEVTLWPHFLEFLSYAKDLGYYLKISTNASCDINYFEKLISVVDLVVMEYHPEFAQKSHFMICADKLAESECQGIVVFKAIPNQWDELEKTKDFLKKKWPKLSVFLEMTFDDPVLNMNPAAYEEWQKEMLKKQPKNIVFYKNGEEINTNREELMFEKNNTFQGSLCNIGVEQIIVTPDGRIKLGHCRPGRNIGRVGGDIKFPEFPTTCPWEWCTNAFDLLATKFKSV